MRIHRLKLQNFKMFADSEFSFHSQLNVLVGENATGKTSILDGLAVALGVWLVHPPDTLLANSRRNILKDEIRIKAEMIGDRVQFRQLRPTRVEVVGDLNGTKGLRWVRQVRDTSSRTSNAEAAEAQAIIQDLYRRDAAGERVVFPVLANYGAGRAWLPSNERKGRPSHDAQPARRWEAYYDCFSERIRASDLRDWFLRETTAAGTRGGQMRPGFEAVKCAILRCLPGSTDLWYDPDREDIVAALDGVPSPFANFSAGQRMLLAMVGDIAMRAVTLNAHLLSEEARNEDTALPRVLAETPGVVLIDELEVHLHPRWQRRVLKDLTNTFPQVQFFGATHSPQVIGEVHPDSLLLLRDEKAARPAQSFGMDSNWILETLMDGDRQDPEIKKRLDRLFGLIEEHQLAEAKMEVQALRSEAGNSERLQQAASWIDRLQVLKR